MVTMNMFKPEFGFTMLCFKLVGLCSNRLHVSLALHSTDHTLNIQMLTVVLRYFSA